MFTDRAGRAWELPPLTLGDFPRFRTADIDLNAAMRSGEQMADLLFGDPERLGRLAWLLCEKQAGDIGVSPGDFAGGFDGPTLGRFGEAVGELVADFFPRSAVAAAIKGRTKADLAAMDAAMIEMINRPVDPSKKPAGGSPA